MNRKLQENFRRNGSEITKVRWSKLGLKSLQLLTWKGCRGNFTYQERKNLTCPELLKLCTDNGHEAWVTGYLNSEDSLVGPHNKDAQGEAAYKH